MSILRLGVWLFLATLVPATCFADQTGILLLAHGGDAEWNARVLDVARRVDRSQPIEVAFGMATRANIQAAVDRLTSRGVTEIVAVPLFVSSWSSVITSTEFLLGLRPDAPPALATYAKMAHPDPIVSSATSSHQGHEGSAAGLGATPVSSKVPITRITPALNAHPLVAEILTTRARSISRVPREEAVILVAHGPVADDENRQWLADMRTLADGVARQTPFASIDVVTLRDDAPKPVRDAATAELRALVSARTAEGRRLLIVPLLLSFGGIERGIATRLEGMTYVMPSAALIPDDRVAEWVLAIASHSGNRVGQ